MPGMHRTRSRSAPEMHPLPEFCGFAGESNARDSAEKAAALGRGGLSLHLWSRGRLNAIFAGAPHPLRFPTNLYETITATPMSFSPSGRTKRRFSQSRI